jgi:hypothetical protein
MESRKKEILIRLNYSSVKFRMKTPPAVKFIAIVFSLFLVILFTTPNLAQAKYATGNPVTDQLLDLAQEKLDAEHKGLISGKAEDITAAQFFLAGKAAEKVKDVTDLQLRRNKILAEHGQKYTKYESSLTVQDTDISDGNAKITARESVTLTLIDKNSTEPVYTKEEKTHVFHFTRQGNKWIVTEDAVEEAFRPAIPDEGAEKITGKPVSLDITGKSGKTKKEKPQSLEDMVLMATAGTYNPGPAVNYARSYWNNYNTAYRRYVNDCTNFTSQAINWGGWQHKTGWYTDPNFGGIHPMLSPSGVAERNHEAGLMCTISISSPGTQGEQLTQHISLILPLEIRSRLILAPRTAGWITIQL